MNLLQQRNNTFFKISATREETISSQSGSEMFPAGTHAAAAAVQAAAAAAAGGLLPNHSFAVKDLISSGQDARERKSFGHWNFQF